MPSDRVSNPESTEPDKNPPRVFISYSHDSEEHAARVLDLANQLRDDGVDAWIDQYEAAPSQGWPLWMEEQVEQADFVLCVCTEIYRRRFEGKEARGTGLGVTWEGALVRIRLYLDQTTNRQFFPVLLEGGDPRHVPLLLGGASRFRPSTPEGYDALYRLLTDQPKVTAPPLGRRRVLSPQPRRSLFGNPVADSAAEADTEPLAAYATWAKKHYAHLDLIGIDAGDVQVQLEEVFVPLRVASRRSLDGKGLGMFRGGRCLEDGGHQPEEAIEIEDVLRRQDQRHVLIFGEPGSGKTTALLKLHQLCWQSAKSLGLDAGTVPVFLRLRHFDEKLLDEGLAAFVEHEVYQLSGGRQKGLGEKLWSHGRLLLLFDGLDEIADATHREEVLRRIGWYLGQDGAESMRAVVSCRRVGLPRRDADRDGQFETYEVRPFDNRQIAQLVELWFREVARRDKIDPGIAGQRVTTILGALRDRSKSSQQILEMASNPLLLTLLCVVVLLGNEIPKKRVRFYEQCLTVLLDRWPRQRGKEGPVDLTTARELLGRLAFGLHVMKRRDDLRWAEAVAELKKDLGDRRAAVQFFDWLHGDVGLLQDYTEEDFGFVHLGLQEHLTACHLVAHPRDLEFLQGDYDETWWTEVFLQISALSERAGFDTLMSRLLEHTDTLERRAGLLRECLNETSRPDLSALIRVLKEGEEKSRQAVLRLLVGTHHRPSELVEVLENLADTGSSQARSLAAQILDEGFRGVSTEVALVYQSPGDRPLAQRLANLLNGWRGGYSVSIVEGTGRESGRRLESATAILALLSGDTDAWGTAEPLRLVYDDKLWLTVNLPGSSSAKTPEVFSDCEALDWVLDDEDSLLDSIASRLPTLVPEAASGDTGKALQGRSLQSRESERTMGYAEPITGMSFLPVPGGSFEMGDEGIRVRLSPFALARTPTTNRQYGLFLEAVDHPEPLYWRDRRFSNPDQPVVGVSWHDAVSYCEWLTATGSEGYLFGLPSEAQWEFAARGSKGRRFPWGDEEPSDRLACFGLDYQEGKPAAVGSFVDGVGPHGHLDLAGLVWEWCCDAWEEDRSHWAQGEPPLDPVGEADPDLRPLRGGAWFFVAEFLRSAIRNRYRPGFRDDGIGFRVLCAPPSLPS